MLDPTFLEFLFWNSFIKKSFGHSSDDQFQVKSFLIKLLDIYRQVTLVILASNSFSSIDHLVYAAHTVLTSQKQQNNPWEIKKKNDPIELGT